MGPLLVVVIVIAVLAGAAVLAGRRRTRLEAERREGELAPVRQLAFEDVTALGEQLQDLDAELAGFELDAGARADYQRALDAYESAKTANDRITEPDDVRDVTSILDDGRYAVACVRARVAGEDLPTRRPPCFFDPRHGLSTEDVAFTPSGGAERDVPACALDAERVKAGAEPDVRKVLVGTGRRPYWESGPGVEPYAAGYFGAAMVTNALFVGMLMAPMATSFDTGYDGGGDPGGMFGDGGGGGGFDGGGGGFDGGGGF